MRERPILFSGEMVRAILDGRKTQTRRVVKPTKQNATGFAIVDFDSHSVAVFNTFEDSMSDEDGVEWPISCPHGGPSDRIWVRESCLLPPYVTQKMLREGADTWPEAIYYADGDIEWAKEHGWKSTPSIHMPRWASRITLEIQNVRVERLHDITGEDAVAEGAPIDLSKCPRDEAVCWFRDLWIDINGEESANSNPWVWVIEFERVEL